MSEPGLREPGALGSVFGETPASQGTGGLGSMLPKRGATPAAAEQPTVESAPPAAEPTVRPEAPPNAPAGEHKLPAADALLDSAEPTYQVSVYVLPDVIQAATRVRRRTKQTNAEIAYDAIDAVKEQLGVLIAARRGGAQRPADSLFPGRRMRNPRRAAAQEGRRQLWSIQMSDAELAVLDGLVDGYGAASRSELVSCAVEAHLGRRRPRSR